MRSSEPAEPPVGRGCTRTPDLRCSRPQAATVNPGPAGQARWIAPCRPPPGICRPGREDGVRRIGRSRDGTGAPGAWRVDRTLAHGMAPAFAPVRCAMPSVDRSDGRRRPVPDHPGRRLRRTGPIGTAQPAPSRQAEGLRPCLTQTKGYGRVLAPALGRHRGESALPMVDRPPRAMERHLPALRHIARSAPCPDPIRAYAHNRPRSTVRSGAVTNLWTLVKRPVRPGATATRPRRLVDRRTRTRAASASHRQPARSTTPGTGPLRPPNRPVAPIRQGSHRLGHRARTTPRGADAAGGPHQGNAFTRPTCPRGRRAGDMLRGAA